MLDTNIIGTFTLLDELDLLFALFAPDELGVTPAVYHELIAGLREGRQFLQSAIVMVETGKLSLLALTANEVVAASRLPEVVTFLWTAFFSLAVIDPVRFSEAKWDSLGTLVPGLNWLPILFFAFSGPDQSLTRTNLFVWAIVGGIIYLIYLVQRAAHQSRS